LDVVDRDDDRSRRGEVAEDGDRGRRDGALPGDGVGATRPQQRNFERVPLGRRKRSEDIGLDAFQQICERRVGERGLHLGRCARQHAERRGPRRGDPFAPQRRLADPRLAFEHARGGAVRQRVEEAADGVQFLLSPEDVTGHTARVGANAASRQLAVAVSCLTLSEQHELSRAPAKPSARAAGRRHQAASAVYWVPGSRSDTHRKFDAEQTDPNVKAPTCGALAEPSDGLEPSTPSLPWRVDSAAANAHESNFSHVLLHKGDPVGW
jgi:hypothetical protein